MRDAGRMVAALREMRAEAELVGALTQAERERIDRQINELQERMWRIANRHAAERRLVARER